MSCSLRNLILRACGLLNCWGWICSLFQSVCSEWHKLRSFRSSYRNCNELFFLGHTGKSSGVNANPQLRHGLLRAVFFCCCCLLQRRLGRWVQFRDFSCFTWENWFFGKGFYCSLPEMVFWLSCLVSLLATNCSTCSGVLVPIRSSRWIALLLIKAKSKSLGKSTAAVSSQQRAPRDFCPHFSSFSSSICLHVKRRKGFYVVN